jgi:2-dehydro-3-deoxygluconokinase
MPRPQEAAPVLCLGETMAVLVPAEPGPAHLARTWTRAVGGAESNVACHLVALGVPARWVSAVGADAFGAAVLAELTAAGVDVTDVRTDPDRPTGLYVKEADAAGSPVRYYRAGSAAAALGPDLLDRLDLTGVRLVHVSGITAALSDSCLDLLRAVLRPSRPHLVSFDLNWRPALWRHRDPTVLRDLANAADIVLAGADEAELVWGTGDPVELRALLPDPRTLVIKQGARGATLVTGDTVEFQPALRVEVVEPVGAGDAFAAGFLAATLAGQPPATRLRAGHLQAAVALLSHEDVGHPLPAHLTAGLLAADTATWSATHLRAPHLVTAPDPLGAPDPLSTVEGP